MGERFTDCEVIALRSIRDVFTASVVALYPYVQSVWFLWIPLGEKAKWHIKTWLRCREIMGVLSLLLGLGQIFPYVC